MLPLPLLALLLGLALAAGEPVCLSCTSSAARMEVDAAASSFSLSALSRSVLGVVADRLHLGDAAGDGQTQQVQVYPGMTVRGTLHAVDGASVETAAMVRVPALRVASNVTVGELDDICASLLSNAYAAASLLDAWMYLGNTGLPFLSSDDPEVDESTMVLVGPHGEQNVLVRLNATHLAKVDPPTAADALGLPLCILKRAPVRFARQPSIADAGAIDAACKADLGARFGVADHYAFSSTIRADRYLIDEALEHANSTSFNLRFINGTLLAARSPMERIEATLAVPTCALEHAQIPSDV